MSAITLAMLDGAAVSLATAGGSLGIIYGYFYDQAEDIYTSTYPNENLNQNMDRDYPHSNLRNTLATFINNGRMVVMPETDEHEIMERLRQDYIVDNRNAYRRHDGPEIIYTITPRYRNVIRAFQEVFDGQ